MKKIFIVVLCVALVLLIVVLFLLFNDNKKQNEIVKSDFSSKLISVVNKENKDKNNYLISPYSIEMALRMLSEGTDTTTFKEINNLIGNRDMPFYSSEKRISVANALFLRDIYKDKVKNDFIDVLKSNYDADVLIDAYKTPNKINNWVNNKTFEMIPKIIDDIDKDFVLGLANAIAIDVEWSSQFECANTRAEDFKNGKITTSVEMMYKTFENNVKYFNNKDLKGIILPYLMYDSKGNAIYDGNGVSLEFVALLPDNIEKYLDEFTIDSFNNTIASFKSVGEKEEVYLSLPRFKYDYSLDLTEVLKELGIKEIFTNHADFTKIFGEVGDLTISDAIHKTHIELSETGTKAAAVTYFGMKNTAMPEKKKTIDITFDKPFIYAIRDTKTKEILFIGVVYNPNPWNGTTCKGE